MDTKTIKLDGVGLVVHFVEDGKGHLGQSEDRSEHVGRHSAAIIVDHENGKPATLMVMVSEGLFIRENVNEDETDKAPGTWHEPELARQIRLEQ